MKGHTLDTLKELHQIREEIAMEEKGLSARKRVERVREEANALLRNWGLTLKQNKPPSKAIPR